MLSFTSSLGPDSDALVIFANEKYGYKDKKGVLSKNTKERVNSYLANLKTRKEKENITSFEISDKKKCFIIRIENNYESYALV